MCVCDTYVHVMRFLTSPMFENNLLASHSLARMIHLQCWFCAVCVGIDIIVISMVWARAGSVVEGWVYNTRYYMCS